MPRRSRPRPLATFRLSPEADTARYVRVVVWPTRAALTRAARHYASDPRHALALCIDRGLEARLCRRRLPRGLVAEVHLFRAALGPGVVGHELYHATVAYGRRLGINWAVFGEVPGGAKHEERLAGVHGRLCALFARRAAALGLYADRYEAAALRAGRART